MSLLEHLKERIRHQFGLTPRAEWDAALGRGLGTDTALPADMTSLRQLASQITIGESHFFRHLEHLEQLTDWLSVRLRAPETVGRKVHVWSAGCCRGEEPFSVVMLLLKQVAALSTARFEVLGTDLNHEAIHLARRGVYGSWSMRGVVDEMRTRHFRRLDANTFALEPNVTRFVRFENLSIQEQIIALGSDAVDAILFRNVAVYMDLPSAAEVYEGLTRVLRKDGVLVISATDPQPERALLVPINREQPCLLRPARGVEARLSKAPASPVRRNSRRRSAPAIAATQGPSLESLVSEATALGDRGQLQAALRLATTAITLHPYHKAGYNLRGRLRLAAEEQRAAAADFERVLGLDPEDHLARYWFAEALRSAGETERCLAALTVLERELAHAPAAMAFDSGAISADELRHAVRAMREAIE